MKTNRHNLGYEPSTYEYQDYIDEQDDKAYRKEQEKRRLDLLKGIAFGFTAIMFLLGLIAGGYRLYMALFPPR